MPYIYPSWFFVLSYQLKIKHPVAFSPDVNFKQQQQQKSKSPSVKLLDCEITISIFNQNQTKQCRTFN